MTDHTARLRPSRRYLILVALLALAIYVIVPQLSGFQTSLRQLSQASVGWTILAVALAGLTYMAAAGTYCLLAFRRLRYSTMVLVQLAAMFVNRLLPAGIGALGANFAYLRHTKHSSPQAASVVALNNLLGFTGHMLLVLIAVAFYSGDLYPVRADRLSGSTLLLVLGSAATVLVIMTLIFGRKRLQRGLKDAKTQIQSYSKRKRRLFGALLTSIGLTAGNVLCLYVCALALGVHLPLSLTLLVFTAGISTGTAVPTPGGLGGFEAGLVAGFVAYGVPASAALAVALLYRLITYWLALLVGSGAFVVSERRKLFTT